MLRYLALLCAVLFSLQGFAQVSEVGTGTEYILTSNDTAEDPSDLTHTVPSGADLLIVSIGVEADESVSTLTWDQGVGNESLTLVDATLSSGVAGDIAIETWALVSPTAKTGTIRVDWVSTTNAASVVATNWDGNDTTDVATATNFIDEDVDDAGSTTCVIASGGANYLYAVAAWRGQDADPIGLSAGWTEVWETTITVGAGSTVVKIADDATAPNSITFTASTEDENACQMLEIVAAATDTGLLLRKRREKL